MKKLNLYVSDLLLTMTLCFGLTVQKVLTERDWPWLLVASPLILHITVMLVVIIATTVKRRCTYK